MESNNNKKKSNSSRERRNPRDQKCGRKDFERKRQDKRIEMAPKMEPDITKGPNDSSWYFVDPKIAKDIGSLPYSNLTGTEISIGYTNTSETQIFTDDSFKSIPGVAVIRYLNTPGKSVSGASAYNIATRAIYTWVRHQNSGSKNYEAADLGMYILAMSDLYNAWLEAKRVCGLVMTYLKTNRYYPKDILYAMGYDADDIMENIANFRGQLNILATQINSLCVPQAYDVFKRQAMLALSVFSDADTERGQFYVFKCDRHWVIDPTNVNGTALIIDQMVGTSAVSPYHYATNLGIAGGPYHGVNPMGTLATASAIISQLYVQLNAILLDEDFNIMSGDILKAYGRENLYNLQLIADDFTVEPVYEPEILNQIENCHCVSLDGTATSCLYPGAETNNIDYLGVYQNNGAILFDPKFSLGMIGSGSSVDVIGSGIVQNVLLNAHTNDPSAEVNLENTRCCSYMDPTSFSTAVTFTDGGPAPAFSMVFSGNAIFGTELYIRVDYCLHYFNGTAQGAISNVYTAGNSNQCFKGSDVVFYDGEEPGYAEAITAMSLQFVNFMDVVSKFDWHPIHYMVAAAVTGTDAFTYGYRGSLLDTHTYTVVSMTTLKSLHDCATQGLFKAQLIR